MTVETALQFTFTPHARSRRGKSANESYDDVYSPKRRPRGLRLALFRVAMCVSGWRSPAVMCWIHLARLLTLL